MIPLPTGYPAFSISKRCKNRLRETERKRRRRGLHLQEQRHGHVHVGLIAIQIQMMNLLRLDQNSNRLLLIELTQKHTNHFITHTLRLSLSRFSGNKQSIHLFILEIPHFVSTSYSNLYCFHCPKQKQSLYFGQPCSIDFDAFTKIVIVNAATLCITSGARTAIVALPGVLWLIRLIIGQARCSGRWCSGW